MSMISLRFHSNQRRTASAVGTHLRVRYEGSEAFRLPPGPLRRYGGKRSPLRAMAIRLFRSLALNPSFGLRWRSAEGFSRGYFITVCRRPFASGLKALVTCVRKNKLVFIITNL
nr:MAG: hypothetical protein [Cressdnaviricota sp.]